MLDDISLHSAQRLFRGQTTILTRYARHSAVAGVTEESEVAIEFQLTVAIDRSNEWPAGRVTAAWKIRSILPLLG